MFKLLVIIAVSVSLLTMIVVNYKSRRNKKKIPNVDCFM